VVENANGVLGYDSLGRGHAVECNGGTGRARGGAREALRARGAACRSRLAGGYANDIREILRAPYDHHVDWRYQLRNLQAFRNLG